MDKTIRYCVKCEDMKEFMYNKAIGHSECTECGSRYGLKKYTHIINYIKDDYHKKITDLFKESKEKQLKVKEYFKKQRGNNDEN